MSEQPSGLFCRDLAALGYDYAAAVAYWEAQGEPERMDADRNGVPCETVYPADVIAAMFGPGGARALAGFFAAARDLDARIAAAATGFNAGFDPEGPTLDPAALPAIEALDAAPLGRLIPAGMASNLETAVLAVYTDLDSRIAALQRGAFSVEWAEDAEQVLFCLRNGSASNARFDADLAAAERLAADAPTPTSAPDSPAAGILQVRLEAIRLWNWGCDSCGGATYDAPLSVDWEGRTIDEHQVGFSATFDDGRWRIEIAAC